MTWQAFLEALPQAASSPLALIGYLAVVVAFVLIHLGKQKLKRQEQMLQAAKTTKERMEIIKAEKLTKPRDGLSEENWLRSQRMNYNFLFGLVVVILIAVIIVTAITLSGGREKAENAELKERLQEVLAQNSKLTDYLSRLGEKPTPSELATVRKEKEELERQVDELRSRLAVIPNPPADAEATIQTATETVRRAAGLNKLKQIGQALHNYATTTGELDMKNWRVAILPYIEIGGAINPGKIENPYRYPGGSGDDTGFVAIANAKPFGPVDGTENRIIVIEYNKPGIVWNKPGDITVAEAVEYITSQPQRVGALRADGSVTLLSPSINRDTLRKALGG